MREKWEFVKIFEEFPPNVVKMAQKEAKFACPVKLVILGLELGQNLPRKLYFFSIRSKSDC